VSRPRADFWLVVQSDLAFAAAVAAISYGIYEFGFAAVACFYLVPYLVVNHNLVAITYLQHTDTYVPHYRSGAFTFLRGKLSTVDRSWGFIDMVWHRINDTHVLHHIDHTIPHYHAQEATEAIKPLLGDYYLSDNTPFFEALYRSFGNCRCVPDKGDYLYFVGGKNDTAAAKRD
jgi:omega-6 fatty acid desaturase (delta-12 desaturase)